jgi:hypothetical protein
MGECPPKSPKQEVVDWTEGPGNWVGEVEMVAVQVVYVVELS